MNRRRRMLRNLEIVSFLGRQNRPRRNFKRHDRMGLRTLGNPRNRNQHLTSAALNHPIVDVADFAREIFVDRLHALLRALERHRNHQAHVAGRPVLRSRFGPHAKSNRARLTVSHPIRRSRRLLFSDLSERRIR